MFRKTRCLKKDVFIGHYIVNKGAIYVPCHSGCDKCIKNHIDEVEIKKNCYHISLGAKKPIEQKNT